MSLLSLSSFSLFNHCACLISLPSYLCSRISCFSNCTYGVERCYCFLHYIAFLFAGRLLDYGKGYIPKGRKGCLGLIPLFFSHHALISLLSPFVLSRIQSRSPLSMVYERSSLIVTPLLLVSLDGYVSYA